MDEMAEKALFAVVGTVPVEDFPRVCGEVCLRDEQICIQGKHGGLPLLPVNRGTPALLAAAIKTGEVLGMPLPLAFLAGDIGKGDGSRELYAWLEIHLKTYQLQALVFHYLQPDADWHNRVLFSAQEMKPRPLLIADAGFMYAAKMSGQSQIYDLFTPDAGELAFLADEEAPHPFYTRGFILHEENRIPELIARACTYGNAAKFMIVKGKKDYIVCEQNILETVDSPSVEAMEAMGGTGDTLTGIVTALAASGMEIGRACAAAARVNRIAGYDAALNPASQVAEIIARIPKALKEVLQQV